MSAVKFLSFVEQKEDGGWFIKLTDTFDNTSVICNDLEEYKIKLEDMAAEYGNDIEVVWERSKNLTPDNIIDLQNKMAKLQEEYKDEIEKLNTKNQEDQNMQNGFNPND